MTRFIYAYLILLLAIGTPTALACNVTLSSGGNVHSAVATYSGQVVCLNAGTYNLGSTTLSVPAGTTLKCTAANRDNVHLTSTATRGIGVADYVTLHNFKLSGSGGAAEFGVVVYDDTGVLIWALRVRKFRTNIVVNISDNVVIADTFMLENGDPANGLADPNLWINASNNVAINYGEAFGRNDGPFGDGEIACYNSTEVNIYGTHVVYSGASGIYYVNCDDSSISNASVEHANEWGLDIHGSDNFVASNNFIAWSNFGGSVFEEAQTIGGSNPTTSIGGQFLYNAFQGNRQLGVANCNGVNVDWDISHVTFIGNTTNSGSVSCQWAVSP